MIRRRPLPELLARLAPLGTDGAEPAPLGVVTSALSASERIVERLRLVPDTCLYRALARYALLRRAGHRRAS